MADKVTNLYNTFKKNGYAMEPEAEFRKNLQDPKKRKAAYDALVNDGYDMEPFEKFESNIGYGAPQSPQQPSPSAPAPESEAETQSASSQPAKAAQPKWKPSVQDKIRFRHLSIGIGSEGSKRVERVTAPLTYKGREKENAMRSQARRMGANTLLMGATPSVSAEPAEQAGAKPDVIGMAGAKAAQSTQSGGAVPPRVAGVRMENGKAVTEWALPDGSVTTDFAMADRVMASANDRALMKEFESRMERNGLDPAKEEDVSAQATTDIIVSGLNTDKLDPDYYKEATAFIEQAGLDKKNPEHVMWTVKGDYRSVLEYQMRKTEERVKALNQEMAKWEEEHPGAAGANAFVPPGSVNRQYSGGGYTSGGAASFPKNEELRKATDLLVAQESALRKYDQAEDAKDRSAIMKVGLGLWHGITDPNTLSLGVIDASASEALRNGGISAAVARNVINETPDAGGWYNGSRFAGTMIGDPITLVSLGSGAIGQGLVRKGMEKTLLCGVEKGVAQRLITQKLGYRMAERAGNTAFNLATFEGLGDIRQQLMDGGWRDSENVFHEGFSLSHAIRQSGHGFILGAPMGVAGATFGNVSNWATKRVAPTIDKTASKAGASATAAKRMTASGKVAARGAVGAMDFITEGTIFAMPEIYEFQTMDDMKFDRLYAETFGYVDEADPEKRALKREEARNSMSWNAELESLGMVGGMKMSGKAIHPISTYRGIREKISALRAADRKDHRSFSDRVSDLMDRSPIPMQLTSEEKAELKRLGYGNLASLFARSREERRAHVATAEAGEKIPMEQIGFEELRDGSAKYDGYKNLSNLMEDKRVSQATRVKLGYILDGEMGVPATISGARVTKDESGRFIVDAMAANGEVVTTKTFKSEADAEYARKQIMRQAELNSVSIGEQFASQQAQKVAAEKVYGEVGARHSLIREGVENIYEKHLRGEKLSGAEEAIAKDVADSMGDAYKESVLSPEVIRERIKERTGIDVDDALQKRAEERSEDEQRVVEEYLDRLYNDGERMRSARDTWGSERDSWRAEERADRRRAWQMGMSGRLLEAGNEADRQYSEGRDLYEKFEEGTSQEQAEARADMDAIALRHREALEGLEDAFGADAEARMAQLQEDPFAVLSDPELTFDQQDAVLYYINTKWALDGVQDAADESADRKREAAIDDIRKRTHFKRGMIIPAETKMEKQVYIVGGNVVMYNDGSGVDRTNSDSQLWVFNPATGEIEPSAPEFIERIGEAVDPQTELEAALAEVEAGRNVFGDAEAPAPSKNNYDGNYEGENTPVVNVEEYDKGYGDAIEEAQNLSDERLDHYVDVLREGAQKQMQENGRVDDYIRGRLEALEFVQQDRAGAAVPKTEENVLNPTENAVLDAENVSETVSTVENGQQTALQRIPLHPETGEPMFEAVDKDTAWDGLVEAIGGEKDAVDIAMAQIEQASTDLEALKKKPPTLKAPKLKGSPMAMAQAKREANEAHQRAMADYQNQLAEAEARQRAWNNIMGVYTSRNAEKRAQEEAERRMRDAQAHDEAVARFEEEQRIKAEKQAELEAIGTHSVNPKIKARWDSAPKLEGNPDAITLPDGSSIRGRYVLTEAGAASASHDVGNAYMPTEGFPIDENGQSVNDRDYERDKDAQRIVEQMAGAYDNRALQTPVIVSKDGVVLSGNNRTMSGDLAARQGTDKAYVDYLREFGAKYGFTPEQVQGMKNPRLVFVPDETLPYDATTFSRFNAQEMKSQSKPEAAVKLGKIVSDDVFNSIVGDIARYDRLSDYYSNEKAVARALGALMQAGVINDKQMPEMRTGTALSAAGKELIENTLIGKVFQTSPDAVRQIISMPTLRQSIVMGLNEIAGNRTLAKQGYGLSKELGDAVDLVYRAKSAMPEVYTDGMPVSPFGRMQGLFDDEFGDSRVTDGATLLLADLLNSGKPSDIRKVLTSYNNEASSSANGQIDMFSGTIPTKEEILTNINEHFKNATPREQQALVDAAIAERKARAVIGEAAWQGQEPEAEQRGGDQAGEQAADAIQRSAEPQQPITAGGSGLEPLGKEPIDLYEETPEEAALRARISVGDEWVEEGPDASHPIYKRKLYIDGKHEIIQTDAPDKNGSYTGSQLTYDGNKYGDLASIAKVVDGQSAVRHTCPVCGKHGIQDYKSEGGVCPQCGTDLDVFRTIDSLSDEQAKEVAEDLGLMDNQGNPIDDNGNLIVEKVESVDAITDKDFTEPYRTVGLPTVPENVSTAIGTNGRDIIIKKSILVKNRDTHKELTPDDSRKILNLALYNPNLVGANQPIKRPDYKVAIHIGEKNAVVVLDVYAGKDNVEIVGWRKIDAKGLERIKRQATREGGQFLILSPNDGSAAALSALPSDVSSDGEVNTLSSDKQTPASKSAGYTVKPTTYTNKAKKTSNVFELTFEAELTDEQAKAVKAIAMEPTGESKGRFSKKRGWQNDRNDNRVWTFRDQADAERAAQIINDDEAVADAQPLSREDIANEVKGQSEEVKDYADRPIGWDEPGPQENPFLKVGAEKPEVQITDEMEDIAKQMRDILGVDDSEVGGVHFRDPDELKPEQKRKLVMLGIYLTMRLFDQGKTDFPTVAKVMVGMVGEKIKPWIKAIYKNATIVPGYEDMQFTSEAEIDRFDIANFDKPSADVLKQAEMIVAERKAKEATSQAEKEVIETRNQKRKEHDKQTEADTAALGEKAEAVASKAESVAETSADRDELNRAVGEIDDSLDEVNEQLALLGYYEADLNAQEHEVYGLRRSAEKKAVKDATKLAKQLIADLGVDLTQATTTITTDRKGNQKTKKKPLATSNLTGIDGDITINLPMPDGRNLHINIGMQPTHERGVEPKRGGGAWEGDNLEVNRIMYRFESKDGKGDGNNHFLNPEVTYAQILAEIQRTAKWGMPKGVRSDEFDVMSEADSDDDGGYSQRHEIKERENNGFKVGEKVWYTRNDGKGKHELATIVDFGGSADVTLDTGMAPVMYEACEWTQIAKREPDIFDKAADVADRAKDKREKKKSAKKSLSSQKQPEVKPEQPIGDLFSGLFDEPIENNANEKGRNKDTRRNNSGTEPEREALSETEPLGAGASIQDSVKNSESKRRRSGVCGGKSGTRPQYDVNKNYSNEEIHEIASSVATIKDGKGEITGEVTDDIKAICRQYKSGGVAKKGRGVLDEYYTDGKIVDAVRMLIRPYFDGKTARVLEPSVGIGNFADAWQGMSVSEVVAFEINETTARIAKILHPEMDVNLRSFETEFIDDSGNKKPLPEKFNLIVGNPPYGSHRGFYKGLGEESKIARYEDYFVKRSLDVLEEGGVLAMVLPSSWIDRHAKYGGYTVEMAYRLPSGAFESTQVSTDIVVLRKDSSVPVAEHIPYFEQYPENVCGEVKQRSGRFGKQENYVEGSIDAAIENIKREHAKLLADKLDIEGTADNLNDIQSAIDETGDIAKAASIVQAAKTTKVEKTSNDSANHSVAPKSSPKNGKYKVELRKGTDTVAASLQFQHEFSDGAVAAFEDTKYDGTLDNPSKHRKFANYIGGRIVHDFYYAEGDIYNKLEQLARDKAIIVETFGEEQYNKQKELLESVLPKRKGIDEITISPNTTFVKNLTIHTPEGKETLCNIFIEFCRKLPYQAFGSSSCWEVTGYVENEPVYGQDKQRNLLVRERRKRVANDLFMKFLNEELSDTERSQVVNAFNREYNSMYRPDYSKVPMFSTINRDFKGKPLKLTNVQLAGVGRMTVKGVGVLAHEVGFGKTLSGVLAMHEAMTRGFAKKPLIVVPNDNILKQWVETIEEVLPQATVNMLGNLGATYDLTDFKVNDFEFTIVTYEGLKAMSFSDDTYTRLADRFSYITEDLKKHQSERDVQKALEKRKELKGKMKRGTKPTYRFEDFGFDYLTVDEVHNANHIVSKVRLDKSVASDFRSQSQRTSDLGMKTWLAAQYIQELNDGRNVLLLSATPFTNKPLEYYSILSLVGNDMLRRKGFFNVDQFFATFMEADNELEIGANGRPVQKTNVRKFRNNGLFQQLLSEFIDIKGEEDNPDLERPERINKEYRLRQNALTAEAIAAAQDLLSDNDTVLQGINHARAAAFSPYATSLLGLKPKDYKEFVENSPKIDATVRMIEQNRKDRPDAGQIVYSQVGVEFFPMIRDYLVKKSGFKPGEVRIITGATSNTERVNIQTAFNNGEVKVVIGSPAIKEGLNLQGNTTDMYILSLPWNFTELRQIEGRGWRQGNKWENIRINYMLTDDSVDAFMLQRLQTKQGLYNEAMKRGAESVDVSDIDTAELKTALITDPAIRAEIVTMQERARLTQEKAQIEADLAFIMRKYKTYNELMEELGQQRTLIERYKDYAKNGGYWVGAVKDAERKLTATEQKIEQEKQKLVEKGINVDDIERQAEQSRKAIDDIAERIEHLKDYEPELAEKYRQDDRAKERGDALPSYLNERKKENRGGFYKLRPTKDKSFSSTENPTTRFRDGYSDGERLLAIRELESIEVSPNNLSKAELQKVYRNLPSVVKDGREVEFYHSAFKKIYKEGGLFGQIVPVLDEVLEQSVLAYSESDDLGGMVRPDGTVHKDHPNTISFDNYVGKVKIGGEEYFVRITIQNDKGNRSGMHSCFVTNVEVYKNTAGETTNTEIPRVKSASDGIVDAKLQQFFERASAELLPHVELTDENETPSETNGDKTKFRVIDEGEDELLSFLNNQPLKKGYRYAQWADMGVRPPMTAKVNGEWRPPMLFSRWEQSEEGMRKANGKADLVQGNGRTTGDVAYNPYFHIRTSPLNDQFTAAYDRPELIVVEGYYPESEETSGYKAEGAKDSVGLMDWHSGSVNGQLSEDTKVQTMLSRYFMPIRIVPWSEVADLIMERVGEQKITFPINAVPPMLRAELAKRGAKFGDVSGQVAKGDIPMLHDLRDRVNAGEHDAGLEKAQGYIDAYESSEEAMEERGRALAKRLNLPVRFIPSLEEAEQLPTARKRNAKGFYDEYADRRGETAITVILPNHANVADVVGTILHEGVWHKGIRLFCKDETELNNLLDHLYENSSEKIVAEIDAEADAMYMRTLDSKKRKYGNDVFGEARAITETEQMKREGRFRRDATEEFGARVTEEIKDGDFEKMSEDKLNFFGKIFAFVEKAISKILAGLKVRMPKKYVRKDWRMFSHMFYERLRKGETPEEFKARTGKEWNPLFAESERVAVRFKEEREAENKKPTWKETCYALTDSPRPHQKDAGLDSQTKSDGAKIQKISKRLKFAISEMPKDGYGQNGLIYELANALGVTMPSSSNSNYAVVNIAGVGNTTVRVSNHSALVGNFHQTSNNVGIVIKTSNNRFRSNESVDYVEFMYYGDKVENNASRQREIIDGLRHYIETGSFEKMPEADRLNTSGKYREAVDGLDDAVYFRDGGLGLEEAITKMKVEAAQANSDNLQAKRDAMRAIGGNLNHLRSAMARQREYDIATAKSIKDLARILMDKGLLDTLGNAEVKSLLAQVTGSIGKQDISKQVDRVFEIMVDNHLRITEMEFGKLISMRASRVDGRGIQVQGDLDPDGQALLKVFNSWKGSGVDEIDKRIASAIDAMSDTYTPIADRASLEYAGLTMAREYAENIKKVKDEEKSLREEIKKAKVEKDAGRMTAEAYKQFEQATRSTIRQIRLDRISAYESLMDKLGGELGESIERAKAWRIAEKRRVDAIHHLANSDMQGRELRGDRPDTRLQNLANNFVVRFLLEPLSTLDQMLKMFGSKNPNGEGYLHSYFMRKWADAADSEQVMKERYHKQMDAKAAEIFGTHKVWYNGYSKKLPYSYSNLYGYAGSLPKAAVTYFDGAEMREYEIGQGELLYLYAVDKMPMGRATNRRMGITDDVMQDISDTLDPKLKEYADWAQEELLPAMGREMDEVHMRLFGAHMDNIENYFPFVRDKNALKREVENGHESQPNDRISVMTGAIKKRISSVSKWDIRNCNFFDVLAKHVDQDGCHWSAFAELNRDLGTLLSYNRLKQQVFAMSSVYGAGEKLWERFAQCAAIATDAYEPKRATFDRLMVQGAKGVTMGKISLRMFTSLKQTLSLPAFFGEVDMRYIAADLMAGGVTACRWAWQNMPNYRKRILSRTAGDYRLRENEYNNKIMRASSFGMLPNIGVDAWTIAIGSHGVYKTKIAKYLRWGMDVEKAERRAIQDAELAFNKSQQSSEGPFMAPIQVDHTFYATSAMLFRNSSTSYTREAHNSARNLKRIISGEVNEDFVAKQILRTIGVKTFNERFNEELTQQVAGTLPAGHIYQLGKPGGILQSAGLEDLPIELSAERLAKKASDSYKSNHPFEISAVKNLPEAMNAPIAVFDSATRTGVKVILTTLKYKGNNFVVALEAKNKYGAKSMEVDINDVLSLYPKDSVMSIPRWIVKGNLLYCDNKKMRGFFVDQWPDYIGADKNSLEIAAKIDGKQRINLAEDDVNTLRDAAKIVNEFENSDVPEQKNDRSWSDADWERARKFAKEEMRSAKVKNTVNLAMFGWILPWLWRIGSIAPLLLLSSDDSEKQKQIEDAIKQSFFAPIEGLAYGDVMSDALGMLTGNNEKSLSGLGRTNPILSDIVSALKKADEDMVAASNDVFNILGGMVLGINPQTITDWTVAIMDCCGDDANTSQECALLVARLLNCPQSQLDKIYFDELSADGEEASRMTPQEIAERYARYKTRRNAPLTGWMYSDEGREKQMEKYRKKSNTLAKERLGRQTDEQSTPNIGQWIEEYNATKKRVSEIRKLKDTDEDAYYDQLADLEQTPEYERYEIVKSYKHDIDEATKEWLRSATPAQRDSLVRAIVSLKKSMVEELNAQQ